GGIRRHARSGPKSEAQSPKPKARRLVLTFCFSRLRRSAQSRCAVCGSVLRSGLHRDFIANLESELRAEQHGVFRTPRAGHVAIERGAFVGSVELAVRVRIPVCR